MPLHHYLPASFLARFSIDTRTKSSRDKQLIVGDKKTQKWFSSPASKVGCINNLYTIADDSVSPEFIDQTWIEYEKKLPTAIDSLIEGKVDAEMWTRVLIPFVACMLVRGPDFEKRFNQRFHPTIQQAMSKKLNPDNANRARLREIQSLLACVVAAKWLVLTTHGKDKLITNDLGFAPFINPKIGHRGLAIPLSQRKILAIVPSMEDHAILFYSKEKWIPYIEYRELPPGNHQGLNTTIAQTALRFVFGPDVQTVQKYFLGVPQVSVAPEPIELGFPIDLLSPAFEFTWHRLVGAIKKKPSDKGSWDFPLDWKIIASGWHSMPFMPLNLVEFPPVLHQVENTIQLKFYNPEIYYNISQIPLLEQEGNHSAVLEIVTNALTHDLSPSLRANLLVSRGGVLADLEKIPEALKDFEDAHNLDPTNVKVLVDYGYTLIKAESYIEAIDILSKAIDLNAKLGAAYLNRGVALWRLHHSTRALEDLTNAINLLSDEGEIAGAHLNRGQIHIEMRRFQNAADDFGIAASLYTEPHIQAKCFARQALALSSLGLLDQALEVYNKSIEIHPTDFDALIGRALLYMKLGEIAKAMKDRETAILYALDSENKERIMQLKDFQISRRRSPRLQIILLISFLIVIGMLIIFLNR